MAIEKTDFAAFSLGFNVGSASAIDKRLILSKREMRDLRFDDERTEESQYTGMFAIPEHRLGNVPMYFALCADDGKMYIYSQRGAGTRDPETGDFHPLEEFLDFTQSEATQEQFEKAVEGSPVIIDLTETVLDEDAGLVKKVADLQEEIQNIKIDGQVIGG